jgi:ribonuclease G
MSKEIYISSTPHETRLAIVEKDELTEIYYERENEYTLAGSIYNGRVTRVLPGMQSSFVDIGLERDAFLYITDFMEETDEVADFEGVASGEPRAPRADKPLSEGRTDGRERGRDRGRGRRDGRDGERRNRDAQPETVRAESTYAEPESVASVDDEGLYSAPSESEVEAVGEGSPGADGSRRWRGRRGRRRGRGGTGDGSVSTPADTQTGDVGDYEANVESEPAPAEIEAKPEYTPRMQEPRGDRSRDGGRSRGGRDRGGRDRNADRGDRGGDRAGRDARQEAIRERFAPRGARPASASDEVIDLNASAPSPEPLILPGESLSKYRKGEDNAASTTSSQPVGTLVTAKPSTEVAPLVGWDGGAILPGETLSRHREPKAEVRSDGRSDFRNGAQRESNDRGRDRRRGRDEQRGRGGRESNGDAPRTEYRAEPRGIDPAEAVLPAVSSQHDVAEREYEPQYPTQTDAVDAAADAVLVSEPVEEFPDAVQEFQETTTEYEPGEDAAASYRVDPSGPSEFRQSAPVEEFELEETLEAAQSDEDHAGEHAFTSVRASGEMVSEVVESVHAPSDPSAPIEHEVAVQSGSLHEAEKETVPFDARQVDAQRGFAPGDGQLEEELLDDDEIEVGTLRASAFDDDTETLENAADLGSMIRDMSIDDITRPEPVEVDEDDEFEDDEDDFEEDELASNGDEDFEEDEVSGSEISEAQEEEFAEVASLDEASSGERVVADSETRPREGGREGGRRGRRDGRRGGRDRGGERSSGERAPDRSAERSPDRSSSSNGSRDRRGMAGSRHGGGRDRGGRSMQSTNLPAISDLLKPGQELLVQIAKEPIAKKGARITSHIALPGRFLVFMPTVGHTGVSRKIESDAERRRLKEILLSERGEATGGFIVRTAAAGASEEELRSDLRFLLNLWADIKARSDSSKSPALIYHDLNLIERILRDQVTDNFSAIWVDTENEYERVLRFLQRFQPSLIRRVKLYTKDTPLFEQFGITEEINKALRAKVWLKSGGSIVINQTEALVAIDINTGKYVGKTARLEDTILKTNLDAIPEIVRQIRLRDLGGIIIIDFIDMDERKNRNKVMAALEDELKKDRAPSKVLQFNDFGLVAITRKRVKQSLERTLSTTCGVCAGTGMVKSPVTVCNDIYIEMRKMHKLIEKGDIMLRVHPEVVKQLKTGSGKWLQEMEEMSGKTILVKSDPSLHPEQFDIH